MIKYRFFHYKPYRHPNHNSKNTNNRTGREIRNFNSLLCWTEPNLCITSLYTKSYIQSKAFAISKCREPERKRGRATDVHEIIFLDLSLLRVQFLTWQKMIYHFRKYILTAAGYGPFWFSMQESSRGTRAIHNYRQKHMEVNSLCWDLGVVLLSLMAGHPIKQVAKQGLLSSSFAPHDWSFQNQRKHKLLLKKLLSQLGISLLTSTLYQLPAL